jgi:hypothetical protein
VVVVVVGVVGVQKTLPLHLPLLPLLPPMGEEGATEG